MMMKQFTKSMLLVAAATGLAACEPTAPANPTWEQDIYPLMVARCIRCHDNPTHVDPLVTAPLGTAFGFNHPTLQALAADAVAMASIKLAPSYVRGEVLGKMMPPAPAEKLEQWQIDMLANWTKNPI